MADIKLFRVSGGKAVELAGSEVPLEKALQTLIEKNLETFLGVRFLASEHGTGKAHGGRIDTLGIDENGGPVIIEYKRSANEAVINQGLFYLDWLLDHRADFKLLVLDRLGAESAQVIDWNAPRLLCIAGDFTRYDEHAVRLIDRNIELIRYKRFGDDLLLFELVHRTSSEVLTPAGSVSGKKSTSKKVGQSLEEADEVLRGRFENLKAFLLSLGDDVQLKETDLYFAFRRIKNFACVEIHPTKRKLTVFVKVDPDSVDLASYRDLLRDVRKVGHYGTGDLEISILNDTDLEHAKPFIQKSYEGS